MHCWVLLCCSLLQAVFSCSPVCGTACIFCFWEEFASGFLFSSLHWEDFSFLFINLLFVSHLSWESMLIDFCFMFCICWISDIACFQDVAGHMHHVRAGTCTGLFGLWCKMCGIRYARPDSVQSWLYLGPRSVPIYVHWGSPKIKN